MLPPPAIDTTCLSPHHPRLLSLFFLCPRWARISFTVALTACSSVPRREGILLSLHTIILLSILSFFFFKSHPVFIPSPFLYRRAPFNYLTLGGRRETAFLYKYLLFMNIHRAVTHRCDCGIGRNVNCGSEVVRPSLAHSSSRRNLAAA